MLRISQLVREVLASQEELCLMKLKVSALSYVHRASVTDEQCWVLTGKQKYSRKICANAAWSTTSPTRTAWGYNVRNFCGERLATDLLSHGETKNLRFG
jgi:hypothetical protein